ncbi:MAG: aminotransferase class I/II-fold pyridoxal phosphate-dependent enzyme, partial [Pseudomonadota bacterium]
MDTAFPFLNASVTGRALQVPFVGPETLARKNGRDFAARLGANESNFGPSPNAVMAMQSAAVETWKYADPTNFDLRVGIAEHFGLSIENIMVGEGIDGLLGDTCKIALGAGSTLVMSDGAYPTMAYHGINHGAEIVRVPFKDHREDLDQLLEKVRAQDARVLYVSNPNNPMGSFWRHTEIDALIDAVPSSTLLLLDEAYADTAPPDAIPPLDVSCPNVLRYRTFSKAYGLAGARIGYAIGHADVIGQFEKVRNHYGVNLI